MQLLSHESVEQNVVRAQELQITSPGICDAAVSIFARSQIRGIPNISDVWVLKRTHNILGVVFGSIVHNKNLEILQALAHDGRNCIRQELRRIKRGNRNGEKRFLGSHMGKNSSALGRECGQLKSNDRRGKLIISKTVPVQFEMSSPPFRLDYSNRRLADGELKSKKVRIFTEPRRSPHA